MKIKIFIIIKMQSLKLQNIKDLDVIRTKKNHCTLVTFTTAVLGLSDSLPQIFIVKTIFSLNLAPGFFHISKKEDFTVI